MSLLCVAGYWSARKESIERCADRLCRFLADLATCDPALATWREKGRSRKQAMRIHVDMGDHNYVLSLLDRGRNRRDVGHAVIEELGFHVGLWNGGNKKSAAGLSITCGLYWTSPNAESSMTNFVVLDLPEDLGDLKQADRMSRVLAAVARAWEPEWAGVMSRDAMSARTFSAKAPFVDWMVFVPRRVSGVFPPSSLVQLENGSLIVVQPDPLAANNAETQESIRRVNDTLRRSVR